MAIAEKQNRRLVGGQRLVCRCRLELPKTDIFARYKTLHDGFFILNARGGSLYLSEQFTDTSVIKVFPPDHSPIIKGITLFPETGPAIELGDVEVRYLNLNKGLKFTGVVVKFVRLSESQIDLLNSLDDHFKIAGSVEEASLPVRTVHRRAS